jgi:hypothetical protein
MADTNYYKSWKLLRKQEPRTLSSNFSTLDGVEWATQSRDDVLSLNLVKVAAVEEAVKPPKERAPLP